MKKIGKIILPLLVGGALGFGMMALSHGTGNDGDSFLNEMLNIATLIVALLVAGYLQIILHEAGHLVFGLMSGYSFVSFRIGSLTLIKRDGRLQFKRFRLAGTGGQCLMAPPAGVPLESVPTMLYNAGGVAVNALTATLALVLLLTLKSSMPQWLVHFLAANVLIGCVFALLNGIPMKLSGVANDGHNMLYLSKNKKSVKAFATLLIANEKVQNGMRPAQMPHELFEPGGAVDYTDSLQCNVEIMRISRILDQGDIGLAHSEFKEMLLHEREILPMLLLELRSEALFTSLATGDSDLAGLLLSDKQLMRYIKAHAAVMSSKQRVLMAKALLCDNDLTAAQEIYNTVVEHRNSYLMQGEVECDIDLMKRLLDEQKGQKKSKIQ